jgi:large repetitive protein
MQSELRIHQWMHSLTISMVVLLALLLHGGAMAGPMAVQPADLPAEVDYPEAIEVKTVIDEGLVYVADGRKIRLLQRTDQIAIAFTPRPGGDLARVADAAVARLTARGGPLSDFEQIKILGPGLRVLQNPTAALATDPVGRQLAGARLRAAAAERASSDVAWTAPVYVNGESGTLQVAADEVIVALNPGQHAADFFASDPRFSAYRPLLGAHDQFIGTVAAGGGDAAVELANTLQGDGRLAWAAPNFYQAFDRHQTPNDPLYPQQWHLHNTGQNGGKPDADVDAPEAWAIAGGGSSQIVVAIVDDGMEYSHPDLAPNLFYNAGEIPGNGIDDDGNGWIDDVNGWDFTANDNFPGASSTTDRHATSVAGLLAAVGNNNIGVAGIAYGVRVLPVRIFGDTGAATTDANIASAIYYAAGRTADGLGSWRAADILNNSWGGGSPNTAITAAFTWAGVHGRQGKGALSFIATANDSRSSISYPASLAGTVPGVIAVGASTNQDLRASYSNYGPQLDFVAPSSGGSRGIVTVDRIGAPGYSSGDYTAGGQFGGTSAATPLAAGIGALILSLAPDLTATQVRGLMRNTTDLVNPLAYVDGFHIEYGYGRVNAHSAVRGVGITRIEVLDGATTIPKGGAIDNFNAFLSHDQTRTFRVRNQGTEDLHLGAISVTPGPFRLAADFADPTLGVGEATTFSVTFTPTADGAASGSLSFTTNDAEATTFEFTLNGSGVTPSIAGYAFEDLDGDGVRDPGEPAQQSWQIYLDQNNNGVLDSIEFKVNPNLAIPDNNATGITSVQTVSGLDGGIIDLNVRLTIVHTWVGDLEISLISPAGTTIPLITRRGGSGDNFTDTLLDDAAETSITAITHTGAPFTGRFRPESLLSAVDGQDPNGVWQLKVADRAGADVGSLVAWSLIFSPEIMAFTDSSGFYAFSELTPQSYVVRRVVQNGWNATTPAEDGYTITVVDANTPATGRDFGHVRQNAIYGHFFDDQAGNGLRNAGDPGAAGWLVYLDQNDDRLYDPGETIFTTSPNLLIPDNDSTGITSSQSVSGVGVWLADVQVRLNITHTWVGDLEISLVSPAGTTIPLITRRGGSGDNFTDTVLDDGAVASIASITANGAPFTGSFRPESPLAAVRGQNPNGVWQLKIADGAGYDLGSLLNWSLIFSGESGLVTPASGNYVFADLPAGAYIIRQVNQVGWQPTRPAQGVYHVSLASGETYAGVEFGNLYDGTQPSVVSIRRVGGAASSAASVAFVVTFDESVTGVDADDFILTTSGLPGALISSVRGSGNSRIVVVDTESGDAGIVRLDSASSDGTVRLDLIDDDSIVDGAGNPLGGPGADNGSFAGGEGYIVDKSAPLLGPCPAAGPFGLYSGLQTVVQTDVDSDLAGLDEEASTLAATVDTSVPGAQMITFTAVDNAGNQAMQHCSYEVKSAPTAVTLLDFGVAPVDETALRITWSTASELDVRGFHLWRSQRGERSQALRITQDEIQTEGDLLFGAEYSFVDGPLQAETEYSYWLQEIAASGSVTEYGPVTARPTGQEGAHRFYLPFLNR